jgi:hypothetical protein
MYGAARKTHIALSYKMTQHGLNMDIRRRGDEINKLPGIVNHT